MNGDDNIGNGSNHDPRKYPAYDPARPDHGYIEERLNKLEYYQETLRTITDHLTAILGTALEYDMNGMPIHKCACCEGPLPTYTAHTSEGDVTVAFPICRDCLKVVGEISLKRKAIWTE